MHTVLPSRQPETPQYSLSLLPLVAQAFISTSSSNPGWYLFFIDTYKTTLQPHPSRIAICILHLLSPNDFPGQTKAPGRFFTAGSLGWHGLKCLSPSDLFLLGFLMEQRAENLRPVQFAPDRALRDDR